MKNCLSDASRCVKRSRWNPKIQQKLHIWAECLVNISEGCIGVMAQFSSWFYPEEDQFWGCLDADFMVPTGGSWSNFSDFPTENLSTWPDFLRPWHKKGDITGSRPQTSLATAKCHAFSLQFHEKLINTRWIEECFLAVSNSAARKMLFSRVWKIRWKASIGFVLSGRNYHLLCRKWKTKKKKARAMALTSDPIRK